MSEEMVGKEVVIAEPQALAKRSKPTLMQVGKGWICTSGLYHPALAADYILNRPRSYWIKVGELARVFTGGNTPAAKKRVRKQLSATCRVLLGRNEFLLYHINSQSRRIEEVKLFDGSSEMERQQAFQQLERMERYRELSREKCELAMRVLALHERLSNEARP